MYRETSSPCPRVNCADPTWCGFCYENKKGRAAHKGHYGYMPRRVLRARWEDYSVNRPKGPVGPKKGTFDCPDDDWKQLYPKLCQGMCDPWWDDGKPRDPWTLKISMAGPQVVITITDKESKLVSFTSSESVTEGLATIEKALEGEGLSWRKSKW